MLRAISPVHSQCAANVKRALARTAPLPDGTRAPRSSVAPQTLPMLPPVRRQCIEHLVGSKRPAATIPDFLLPAFCGARTPRPFSSSSQCASRIGAATITLPPEVNLRLLEPPTSKRRASIVRTEPPKMVEVEGPLGTPLVMRSQRLLSATDRGLGKMVMQLPPYASLVHDQTTRKATLSVLDAGVRKQREMWGELVYVALSLRISANRGKGTTRAYLQNHVLGVSEGHTAILRLIGVGYRATIESSAITKQPEYPGQEFVSLKVGYSHPIELGVPKGVKASTPQPTHILLEGVEKEVVMQFAAKIRMWRKPEPYKGKGIFVNGETIKLKAKKIK